MFDWLKRSSKAQTAQAHIDAEGQSVVSTQKLLDYAAQRQNQVDALLAQRTSGLQGFGQGFGSSIDAQQAWGPGSILPLQPWSTGESDASQETRIRYEVERRQIMKQALSKELYPLHLPDGWGFRPSGLDTCFLCCPQSKLYHVEVGFEEDRPVIIFMSAGNKDPLVQEVFKDKTEFMLFLLTCKTEIKNESD